MMLAKLPFITSVLILFTNAAPSILGARKLEPIYEEAIFGRPGESSQLRRREVPTITEWTALGDSYATGVGAGDYDEPKRCLRFSGAYPRLVQVDDRLTGDSNARKLNNVACSGATTSDTLEWQFRDTDTTDIQYGRRPAFGKPQFATLTTGGDDIGFLGLIVNCVIQLVPWNSCQAQIDQSWAAIKDPALVENIGKVIDKTIDMGKSASGDSFKVFVTGYARFFDATSDKCDNVTWSVWKTLYRYKLTKALRQTFNDMADALNNAIVQAVEARKANGAVYIDWNDKVEGHRYCQGNNDEPAPDNDDIWFFEWPADSRVFMDDFARTIDPSVSTFQELQEKSPDGPQDGMVYVNNFRSINNADSYNAALFNASSNDPAAQQALTSKVRIFHPKPQLHKLIVESIFDLLEEMMDPVLDQCHGVHGRFYMDRDAAMDAATQFCTSTTGPPSYHPINYNVGTDNSVLISIRNFLDDTRGMPPVEECIGKFTTIIDGCDGNDPNNPQNFKFGGARTTIDGWVYAIVPWGLRATEVTALPATVTAPTTATSVSPPVAPATTSTSAVDTCKSDYNFLFDTFHISGSNWSNDALGANGANLKSRIKSCGDLTGWGFNWTPNASYQWTAHGNLPIGTKHCVGDVLYNMGMDKSNCKGAG